MNVNFRYFNLSQWILAYYRRGQSRYDIPNVTQPINFQPAWVNNYAAYLTGLFAAPPLSNAVYTNPTADNKNLTYVLSPVPLFTSPVGDRTNSAQSDGTTPLARFWAAFNPILNALPHPLFSVIDHNGGHNLTALLARLAFQNAGSAAAQRARLLINFDFHADWTTALTPNIRCSTWSSYVVRQYDQWVNPPAPAGPFADAYLWLGCVAGGQPVDWSNSRLYVPGDARYGQLQLQKVIAAPPAPAPVPALPNVMNIARQAIMAMPVGAGGPAPTGIDVYVTVDRDFMSGSMTPWSEGQFTSAQGIAGVQQCLASLNQFQARLVGFDITGLPVPRGQNPHNITNEAAWTQSNNDIQQCYQLVSNF